LHNPAAVTLADNGREKHPQTGSPNLPPSLHVACPHVACPHVAGPHFTRPHVARPHVASRSAL